MRVIIILLKKGQMIISSYHPYPRSDLHGLYMKKRIINFDDNRLLSGWESGDLSTPPWQEEAMKTFCPSFFLYSFYLISPSGFAESERFWQLFALSFIFIVIPRQFAAGSAAATLIQKISASAHFVVSFSIFLV
jgi:hypothetical protein